MKWTFESQTQSCGLALGSVYIYCYCYEMDRHAPKTEHSILKPWRWCVLFCCETDKQLLV